MRFTYIGFAPLVFVAACAGVDPEVLPVESRPATIAAAPEPEDGFAAASAALARAPEAPERALDEAITALRRMRADAGLSGGDRRRLARELGQLTYAAAELSDEGDRDLRLRRFEEAKNFAYEALLAAPDFKAAMDAKRPIDATTLALVPPGFAEELLLCAAAWGRAAELRGLFAMMGDRARIFALASRALELDERALYGGPHRFFGAYWSKLPGIAGRDLDQSREHFDKALAIGPEYLENRVLFVEAWLVEKGEKERAKAELAAVIATPLDPRSRIWIEQHVAQVRARRILAKLDDGAAMRIAAVRALHDGRSPPADDAAPGWRVL